VTEETLPDVGASTGLPPWVVPGGIAVVAFVFRIVLGHRFPDFGGDAPGYTRIGMNLAAGHGYSLARHAPYLATDIRPPGYPALLGLAFLFGTSHWSVVVLNAALGALSTFLVWLIADGLHLTRSRALWATWIAAFFLSTASIAGSAIAENLSVPAVLALVYVVLIRPRRSRLVLFVAGSALAWVASLTRDELVVFVAIVAVLAGRRANLKVLGTAALVVCFLLGSGAWVLRNEVQVHRTEYVDSVMTDQVITAAINGSLTSPIYVEGRELTAQPTISSAQRSAYHHRVQVYVTNHLKHHVEAFVENKAEYLVYSVFPYPIFSQTYGKHSGSVRLLWYPVILAEYIFSLRTAIQWWKSGRRRDVVSVALFPTFILVVDLLLDPQSRFLLPANLLLLPLAVEGVYVWIGNWAAAVAKRWPRRSQACSAG